VRLIAPEDGVQDRRRPTTIICAVLTVSVNPGAAPS
jgi:hypothetical protein